MVDFPALLDGPIFDVFGVAATYRTAAGAESTITVLVTKGTSFASMGHTRLAGQSVVIQLRAGDVALPAAGDTITVDGSSYIVRNTPERDDLGIFWTLDLGK